MISSFKWKLELFTQTEQIDFSYDLQHDEFMKNSKVFEQKGDLLNFKANIDPMAVLS